VPALNYWLHFIGRQYYTRQSFVKEARQFGVSRRVSLNELKKMDWGDTVLLAIMEGKSGVLFGQFTIERLTGLSRDASLVLEKWFGLEKVNDGGIVVRRGCGEYVTGPEYRINASLAEIADILQTLKTQGVDIGRPMVGGSFRSHQPVRLADIPHRQGFRMFNYTAFITAVKQAKAPGKSKLPAVKGQFYMPQAPLGRARGGLVQEVANYHRKEELSA
jgi:hypothetical protein